MPANPSDMTGVLDTSGYGQPVSAHTNYRLAMSNAAGEVGESTFLDSYDDTSLFAVVNWSVAANVVTLATSANHGFTTGQRVIIVGVDKTIDGSYVLASGATTAMTFALTHAVQGSTPIVVGQAVVGLAVTIAGLAGFPQSAADISPILGMTYDAAVAAVAAVAASGSQYNPMTGQVVTGLLSQNVT